MSNHELAEELAREFLLRDYQWAFDDGLRVPTEEELLKALEALKENTPDRHFQAQGRLVAINTEGHLDLYLHIGEIE